MVEGPDPSDRIVVREYGPFQDLSLHGAAVSITSTELRRDLEIAATRIRSAVSVENPIEFDRGRFRVVDVAGLIRLRPNLVLEVVPKFLASDDPMWREDFFAIATLARYGRILPRESLSSGIERKGDLADLIAHALIALFDANYRRPLRVYRRRSWVGFELDGEVDPDSIRIPEEEGFVQQGIILDRCNSYNQLIYRAMNVLVSEVRDGDVRRQLSERLRRLSPQLDVAKTPIRRRLPSRHRRWQDVYDLSHQVLGGYGLGYERIGRARLPGYIIRTASTWESLLFLAIRAGMYDRTVTKRKHVLGMRMTTNPDGTVRRLDIDTEPDATVIKPNGSMFLVDAKYKRPSAANGSEQPRIASSDVYEAFAFLQATHAERAVLVYPGSSPGSPEAELTGRTHVFERLEIEGARILGMTIGTGGIAQKGGFYRFSGMLSDALRRLGG